MNRLGFALKGQVGNEAININTNLKVHQELTELIDSIRSSGSIKLIRKRVVEIEKFILDTLGITVKLKVLNERIPNAMVQFQQSDVSADNPITNMPSVYRTLKGDKKTDLKRVSKIEGFIDLDKCKVKGELTKLSFPMFITEGLLMNPVYSAGEIAAILEHECGHIFTLLLRLNDAARVNYAISTSIAAIYDIEDREQRVSAIKAMKRNRILNTLDENPDLDRNVALSKALGNYFCNTVTADGVDTYSLRSWEFSSDQFAGRLGAGRDLFTGLDKMMRDGGADRYGDLEDAISVRISMVLTALFMSLLGPVGVAVLRYLSMILLIIGIANSDQKVYDDPAERLERIIQTNTSLLRDPRISKERRDAIIAENSLMRKEALSFKVRTQSIELIKRYIFGGRKAHNDKLQQQQLEELLNGASVEIAARAKQITDLAKG